MAVDAEIDRAYVSCLEGGLENPTFRVMELIAGALDAEIVEFFDRAEPRRKPPARCGGLGWHNGGSCRFHSGGRPRALPQ